MKAPTLTVGPTDAGQRLDRYLKRMFPAVPFVGLQRAIRTGLVRVNGRKAPMDTRLLARDVLTFPPDFTKQSPAKSAQLEHKTYQPSKADFAQLKAAIVYEDRHVLALNKPQGLPAQAGGGQVKSLDRLLAAVYGSAKNPKLVHRLDRETTGLILCAKNRTVAAALGAQWASRDVVKGYLALVLAPSLPAKGEMHQPLGRHGPIAVVTESGDPASTYWVNLGELEAGIFMVLAFPLTGRMNQIRVHFAHAGWPLVGDDKYGDFPLTKAAGKRLQTGLALHAWRLKVTHPQSGEPLLLEAPLPMAWQTLLAKQPGALAEAAAAWQRWAKNKG